MERRDLLKSVSLAVAGTAAIAAVPSPSHAAATTSAQTGHEGKALLNRPRAYAVMEELKLDGLIALNPINVYYLSNTWPLMTKFGIDYPAFATFARDPQQPTFLVTSGIAQELDFANRDRELPEMITWSSPVNWQDYIGASPEKMKVEPQAAHPHGWPTHPDAKLTAHEQAWADAQQKYGTEAAASPAWALAKALKQSGLTKGRIAIDDPRIAMLLQRIGLDGITFVPGSEIFRKIRVVKSEAEIALVRIAGRNNAEACLTATRAIQKGMTDDDIQRMFATECTKRGSEAVFILAGIVNAKFPEKTVPVGKSFGVDAFSHYKQYHGDFGRTIVLGEPSKELLAREKAHNAGYDAIYSVVKAGMKLSEVRQIVLDAEIKGGMPAAFVACTAHSVGLEHGDNPMRTDVPFDMPEDIALEENMVITIDMPYIEIGGNFGHHEDLIRITKTGFEPMNEPGKALVVV